MDFQKFLPIFFFYLMFFLSGETVMNFDTVAKRKKGKYVVTCIFWEKEK
jgi:hypothetical protein